MSDMSQFGLDIQTSADVSKWRHSLIPLAVRRATPMMRHAAIPAPMCEKPGPLLATMRSVIGRVDRATRSSARRNIGDDRWWNDDLRFAVSNALELGLGDLSRIYGNLATLDLVQWLRRNEVEWPEREAWWAWWLFFDAIAGHRLALAGRRDQPSALEELIRTTLSDRVNAALNDDERRASAIPLSPTERRLVAYEISIDEPEPGNFDVVGHMALAANRELARTLHNLLRLSVSEPEWRELVDEFARHRAT